MYLELDNDEYKLLKEIEDITSTDYDMVGNLIPIDNLISVIDNLKHELDYSIERYKKLEQEVEENCKPIPVSEQYDISDKDFL